MAKQFANSGDSDQMLHSAASDLGLHCLPITLLMSPDYPFRCLLTIMGYRLYTPQKQTLFYPGEVLTRVSAQRVTNTLAGAISYYKKYFKSMTMI